MPKTTSQKIAVMEAKGLTNCESIINASRRVKLPLEAACALMQKESGGRNVYGHDSGGVFSRDEYPTVTGANFFDFIVRVMNGATSNGVGPSQITYAGSNVGGHRDGGYFREMAQLHLRPWIVEENMQFGFKILKGHYDATHSWVAAGTRYNGAESYGRDLAAKVEQWKKALA